MTTSQIVEITDRNCGSSAQILVSQGFNCFSWRAMLSDGPREMLWAEPDFTNGEKRASGSGIPLLFPFPGRIGGAAYTFEGREYRLEPGDAFGNAIHGFVLNRPWRVVEQSASRVVGEFQAAVDDASILQQWPSDFRIRVSYEVRGRELMSDIRYENTGAGRLPCGFATHAYFRLPLAEGSDPEETLVTVPAREVWEAEQMLATGRKLPAGGDLDLAGGGPLAGRKFDTYFTHLRADADGRLRTNLSDPASGRTLTQTFDGRFKHCCVVYTPPHREAICLEPYTSMADALRLEAAGHATGIQIFEPGESFETTIVLDVSG